MKFKIFVWRRGIESRYLLVFIVGVKEIVLFDSIRFFCLFLIYMIYKKDRYCFAGILEMGVFLFNIFVFIEF